MNVRIVEASSEHKPIIRNLMQLYLYDFSEFSGFDVDEHGLFGSYRWLDNYWADPDRYPFLVYADEKIAGFALINSHPIASQDKSAKTIAEFFILRKYRRHGIGKTVAFQLFDMFPGAWEVKEIRKNVAAQGFWRKAISEYTGGHFQEFDVANDKWDGLIQTFDNSDEAITRVK